MKADYFFINCKAYSIDIENNVFNAFAIKDRKIIFIGDEQEGEVFCDSSTEKIDLAGKTIFPGMSESHTHAPGLAYDTLFNVNLYNTLSVEETIAEIEGFVKKNPNKDSYYGRGFNCSFFKGIESTLGPRKERLDAICKDKPIILSDFGGNCMWMNTAALEKYNIDENTKCPPGGIVELNPETGKVWGIIRNEARIFVPYQSFTEEENYQALKWFQDKMHSFGYTAVVALRPPGTVEPRTTLFHAFKTLEDRGELTLWVHGARDMDSLGNIDEQIAEMLETKAKYDTELMKLTTVKFFLDGVIEGLDGYLLDPYESKANKGDSYRGSLFWDKEKLSYAFQKSMENGFQIHCHAIGDGATHDALDALEKAIANLKPGDYRNILTHLQLVSQEDIGRMSDLNVIANVQAFWHFKSPVMFSTEQDFIGLRADKEYPLNSFVKNNVMIVTSSDFPVTPNPNPFQAIQVGVTRNIYDARSFGVENITDMDDPTYLLNKDERVSLLDMLKSYTINAAYSRYQEDSLGSLEVGKYGDFIVVNQDPFEVKETELEHIEILATYFGGKPVYEKDTESC